MLDKNDFLDCDTLFLDRDGVINRLLPNDYVKIWEEFEFLPGVLVALELLNRRFKNIFIVTNQRGVGKGLMSEEKLLFIHRQMIAEIEKYGGHINKVYYCTDINNNSPNRKPNIGMALQAKTDFPEIDFFRSVMVGDSVSDMEFGFNVGMKTVTINQDAIDKEYNCSVDLLSFASAL